MTRGIARQAVSADRADQDRLAAEANASWVAFNRDASLRMLGQPWMQERAKRLKAEGCYLVVINRDGYVEEIPTVEETIRRLDAAIEHARTVTR